MKVGFHELENQINVLVIVGPEGIVEFYYVGVLGLFENLDLAIGALCVGGMLKGVKYLFECVYFFGGFFLHFPYMSIGTGSYFFYDIKAPENMTLYVSGIRLRHERMVL